MGSQVIGKRIQTDHSLQYSNVPFSNCTCGWCSVATPVYECNINNGKQDPTIGWRQCCGGFCTSQPICEIANPVACNIGKSSKNQDPVIRAAWEGDYPNIKCVYDLDKIDTLAQTRKFTSEYGINNDVIAKTCLQPVTNCANGLKECSRVKSLEDGSDYCRLWFENLPAQTQDAYMESYCTRHTTQDCDCVLRSNKDSYNLLKGMHSYNDGCWWLSCSDNLKYFVPSDLRKPTCPTNICQVIIDVANAEHVNIDDIKNDIVCNFGPQPPAPDSLWDMLIKTLKKYKYQIITITVIVVTIATVALVQKVKK